MEQHDAPAASPPLSGRVKRRTLFYIPGYDPRGASLYHRIYREEAKKQEALNGLRLTIGPRRRIDRVRSAWKITSPETETNYVFLQYDDLIRARWSKTNAALLWDILRYCWGFIRRGVFTGMIRLYRPMFYFAITAPALVLICLLVALLGGLIAGNLLGWPAGLIAATGLVAIMLALRARYEWVFPAFWIGRIGAFALDRGSGNTPDMEPRIDAFAELIAAQVEKAEDDEVLVVGHSAGSHMGVSVVARALRKLKPESRGFSFLMLGHAVPLIGVQPQADAFRAELFEIAADLRLFWVDVSAPGDGLSFPLVDPVTACGGRQQDPGHPSPVLLSPRFHTLFSPDAYRRLRRSFYRLHFQYLMASELPGDYDYYLITAGPLTLRDRLGPHNASQDGHGPESRTE